MTTIENSTIALPTDLTVQVERALAEDLGSADITAELIPADHTATASVIVRESAILCGQPWFDAVFNQVDPQVACQWLVTEGANVKPNQTLLNIQGNARSILTAERTALNFLQTLSGTATTTRHWVNRLQNTSATLLDTRKTLPGLRSAQKYAVRIGGAQNHRMGLYDQFLIKENHIMAAGDITKAIKQARQNHPAIKVEVEVENLAEFEQALTAGADIIMLDNFSLENIHTAVKLRSSLHALGCKLEVSGGIEAENLLTLAQTGIDYISVGALTKHVRAIDFSMRFTLQG